MPGVESGVTSAAQAAALVFATNPLFGSIKQEDAANVGQSASYTAAESGDGYAVSVTMGSGDCPSGCIVTHTWNYAVDRDGTVALVSEQGGEVEVSIDHGTADLATVAIRLVAGPVCPVEKTSPDPGCEPRPVPDAEVVLRDPTGKEVARASTGAGGEVDFFVPGGAYYAEAAAVEGLMGQAEPEAFSVPGGRSVTITLEYDTGIRLPS